MLSDTEAGAGPAVMLVGKMRRRRKYMREVAGEDMALLLPLK
jgi:hypothetical protein